MPHATHVNFIWFRVGTPLPEVKTAPTLVEDMVDLTDYFGDLRQKNSDAFDCTAELQGVAPMRVSFRSLCQTAALLVVHPHTAKDKVPDALCLLVNGLEEPADVAAVKAHVEFPPELWMSLDQSEKPVVAAAFNVNGRLRDPATITVIHVVANVYFNSFGTNSL